MTEGSWDNSPVKFLSSDSIIEDVFLVPTAKTTERTEITNEGKGKEKELVGKGKEKEKAVKGKEKEKVMQGEEKEKVVKKRIINISEGRKLDERDQVSGAGLDVSAQSYTVGEGFWPAEYTNDHYEAKKKRPWIGRGKGRYGLTEEGKANREAWLDYWRQNHENSPGDIGDTAGADETLGKDIMEHSDEENAPETN
jgi:hypothetical protein